jgi:hypothetical protein
MSNRIRQRDCMCPAPGTRAMSRITILPGLHHPWAAPPGQLRVHLGAELADAYAGCPFTVTCAPVGRHVLAGRPSRTVASSSRNRSGSSSWGMCAECSNQTNCLLGAVSNSA